MCPSFFFGKQGETDDDSEVTVQSPNHCGLGRRHLLTKRTRISLNPEEGPLKRARLAESIGNDNKEMLLRMFERRSTQVDGFPPVHVEINSN